MTTILDIDLVPSIGFDSWIGLLSSAGAGIKVKAVCFNRKLVLSSSILPMITKATIQAITTMNVIVVMTMIGVHGNSI